MSPRAACRLDTLGFEHVYDCLPGKADWLARGLPRAGDEAHEPRAIDYARQDAVTCRLHDPIGPVREAVDASPYGFALVISDGGVLLGRLRSTDLGADPHTAAEALMEPGPATVRADIAPDRLRERLQRRGLSTAVVTDPDGRLLGMVRHDDLPTPSSS
jgi:CBS domain containing-hemolysin-like protein